MYLEAFIQKLEAHTGHRCRRTGMGYIARCPAHQDKNPSLSLSENSQGKILLNCFAGCSAQAICEAIGVSIKDLFNEPPSNIPAKSLRTEYLYQNKEGLTVYKKIRIEPGKNGKTKDFYFERLDDCGNKISNMDGVERILYQLPKVLKARAAGEFIFLVEGEKDADRIQNGLLVATTNPEGAKGPWRTQYTEALKDAHIVLLYDEDVAGHYRRDLLIKELTGIAASIKVVALPGLQFSNHHGPDVTDWLANGHTIQELKILVEQTHPYTSHTVIQHKETKPTLIVPGGAQSIQNTALQAGGLLKTTNRFFIRGGALVEVIQDEERGPYLNPIKPVQLASEMESVAQVVKLKKEEVVPTVLNKSQAELIMGASAFHKALPSIQIISPSPVLVIGPDNKLKTIVGYDELHGVLSYATQPIDISLKNAVQRILGLFSDFSFATPSDLSRAIGALITPALISGQLLRARAPLMTVEADLSQAGKGWLVKLIAAVYSNPVKAIAQRKECLGGIEESLNKRLIQGDHFISFDNIRGKIDLPALESLLTEDSYSARIPYMPPIDIDPKRLIFFLTSNKSEMTEDLANRSCCIQIRKQSRGYKFKTFPEGDLIAHVLANSPLYFGALVAVVREWVSQGLPQTNESRHDFGKWSRSVDWIIQNIFQLSPLMDGHQETQKRIVFKELGWVRRVALLLLKTPQASSWQRTSDILELLEGTDIEIPGVKETANLTNGETRKQALTSMGRELSLCFKNSQQKQVGDALVDVVNIDELQIYRRTVKELRTGASGSYDAKEYFFLRQDSFQPATIATDPSQTFIKKEAQEIEENAGTILAPHCDKNLQTTAVSSGDIGERWRNTGEALGEAGQCDIEDGDDEIVEVRL